MSAANARTAASFSARLKLKPETVQDGLFGTVGYTGSAHAPLLLAAALDRAASGDQIAMIAHGDGADALLFRARTPAIRPALQPALEARAEVTSLRPTERRALLT